MASAFSQSPISNDSDNAQKQWESYDSPQLERQHGSLKALVSGKSQRAKQPNKISNEFS